MLVLDTELIVQSRPGCLFFGDHNQPDKEFNTVMVICDSKCVVALLQVHPLGITQSQISKLDISWWK